MGKKNLEFRGLMIVNDRNFLILYIYSDFPLKKNEG